MEMNLVERINAVPLHILFSNLKHSYNSIKYSDLKSFYGIMYAGPNDRDCDDMGMDEPNVDNTDPNFIDGSVAYYEDGPDDRAQVYNDKPE